jgi:hypothetical protein
MKVVVGLSSLPTSAVRGRTGCGRDADRELVGVLKLPANGNYFHICDLVAANQVIDTEQTFALIITVDRSDIGGTTKTAGIEAKIQHSPGSF